MTKETEMSEQQPQEVKLGDAFRNLGKNIVDVFRAAWESPERKNLQEELENGLNEFSNSIKKEVDEFSVTPTGQQIKSDVESLKERIRSGETEAKVRSEVLNALRIVNTQLERITQEISDKKAPTGSEETSPQNDPSNPPSQG
jgi:hypothetical protein